jgi:hypothetical protein
VFSDIWACQNRAFQESGVVGCDALSICHWFSVLDCTSEDGDTEFFRNVVDGRPTNPATQGRIPAEFWCDVVSFGDQFHRSEGSFCLYFQGRAVRVASVTGRPTSPRSVRPSVRLQQVRYENLKCRFHVGVIWRTVGSFRERCCLIRPEDFLQIVGFYKSVGLLEIASPDVLIKLVSSW